MKSGKVYMHNRFAGILTENETGYTFTYDSDYLKAADSEAESIQETHYQTSDCDKVKRGGESTR